MSLPARAGHYRHQSAGRLGLRYTLPKCTYTHNDSLPPPPPHLTRVAQAHMGRWALATSDRASQRRHTSSSKAWCPHRCSAVRGGTPNCQTPHTTHSHTHSRKKHHNSPHTHTHTTPYHTYAITATGSYFSGFLSTEGELWCWGKGRRNGSSVDDVLAPAKVRFQSSLLSRPLICGKLAIVQHPASPGLVP